MGGGGAAFPGVMLPDGLQQHEGARGCGRGHGGDAVSPTGSAISTCSTRIGSRNGGCACEWRKSGV